MPLQLCLEVLQCLLDAYTDAVVVLVFCTSCDFEI